MHLRFKDGAELKVAAGALLRTKAPLPILLLQESLYPDQMARMLDPGTALVFVGDQHVGFSPSVPVLRTPSGDLWGCPVSGNETLSTEIIDFE